MNVNSLSILPISFQGHLTSFMWDPPQFILLHNKTKYIKQNHSIITSKTIPWCRFASNTSKEFHQYLSIKTTIQTQVVKRTRTVEHTNNLHHFHPSQAPETKGSSLQFLRPKCNAGNPKLLSQPKMGLNLYSTLSLEVGPLVGGLSPQAL
ncbi:hypothetical protein V8G54_003703 [Vigna mungo]|uniref:Uncharacterized protein n=1 Tax=Vigna mungo TaxID=3915 RepID=A0AAQ3SEF8_VIGMU